MAERRRDGLPTQTWDDIVGKASAIGLSDARIEALLSGAKASSGSIKSAASRQIQVAAGPSSLKSERAGSTMRIGYSTPSDGHTRVVASAHGSDGQSQRELTLRSVHVKRILL